MNQPTMAISPDRKRVRFAKTCTVTGDEYSVEISMEQFNVWRGGGLIQDVMPELDAGQREFLITKITPAEWDKMFGDGE